MIKGLEPRLLPQTNGYTVGEINLGDMRAAPGWTSLISAGPFPSTPALASTPFLPLPLAFPTALILHLFPTIRITLNCDI